MKVCTTNKIHFLEEPRSVVVTENGKMRMACRYNGTASTPVWIINRTRFSLRELPPAYNIDYNSPFSLLATNVILSMNSTTYQCEVIDNEGNIISSNIALLLVGKIHMHIV